MEIRQKISRNPYTLFISSLDNLPNNPSSSIVRSVHIKHQLLVPMTFNMQKIGNNTRKWC